MGFGLRSKQSWKEVPVTRPKGGASVLRTGGQPRRSFLPLRKLRAADLLSSPAPPKHHYTMGKERE
jgi:hypothetical protein